MYRKQCVVEDSSRRSLFVVLSCCLLLTACGRSDPPLEPAPTPDRADWVIESRIDFGQLAPLRRDRFNLSVPFRAGSIYGNPTSGSYPDADVRPGSRFVIDLNQGHNSMLSLLVDTEFVSSGFRMEPTDARIVRISPALTDPDDGSSLGITNWVDRRTDYTLMLLYFDRPARITGNYFDIDVTEAGYVWVETPPSPALNRVVPQPDELVLAFFPRRR